MAPKPKTKAELKAEAAAEAARLAEIAEQERLERERREAEEYAAAQHARREKIKSAGEELQSQDEEVQEERRQRASEVALMQQKEEEERESERFFQPTHLPEQDVRDEADLNSYIHELHVPDSINMLQDAVKQADEMLFICHELSVYREDAKSNNSSACQSCEQFRRRLFSEMFSTFDKICKQLLLRRDEFTNEKHEMQLSQRGTRMRLGLWVNVAKNLRLKAVDYSDLGLGTDIPRPIITNNVALRLLHVPDDPFVFGESDQFACTLGGVLVIEILEMERLPKVVKGWHMLEVKEGDDKAKKIEYGPVDPITGIREKVPPMTVRYTLPEDILLFEPPVIARYDQTSQTWVEEDINDTVVSEDSPPVVSFSSRQLGPFAIMQDVRQHLPYLSWELSPLEAGGCRIDLQTQSCSLQIEVSKHHGGRRVREEGTTSAAAHGLNRKKTDKVSPAVLFFHLREMGVFLEPELDRNHLSLRKKSLEIEMDVCRGISRIAQDFSVKISQVNKELPPYMAAVSIKPAEWAGERDAGKDDWRLALFRERGEAKFEVEDELRCCYVVPDEVLKQKQPPQEEEKDVNNEAAVESQPPEPTEEKSLKDKVLKRLRLVSYEADPVRALSETPGGEKEEEGQEEEGQEEKQEAGGAELQEKEEVKEEEESERIYLEGRRLTMAADKAVKDEKPAEG
ncbi:hypothetical protein GUITHDRAFT_138392 [Guillardia theta CCMP2712]|uniref:IC97/Casc1 N-terminal domain-containing protein n=1 Tax=Guillardia theta (strain CCMP2712) TaxID=905079 RepID=L1JDW1_GUITC|nr:hypothetical protein GUITHDRAFT_138392 [Guillardia theta CCMP2712]EKX46299.1 hypothetical protein GUITHDRAFT_138392 [Guillardia theta CCMP2712]|eukprot:XP_005833279.1 hypothetical protein GUITHDRAFT_138392 [Guillardia theta CCMP2712]